MTSAARAPRPVRRPAAADAPAPPRLDNLTVSRKEGFRAFAEAPTRHQPENLTVAQLAALSDRARRDYNHRRSIWHANLPLIKTTQVAELLEQLTDIVESNQQDGDKPKGAIAIEGPAGVGKSSAILAFAKDFHLDTIADLGERTGEGHERWPVCRVGLNGNTGIKDFNKAMLGFYNHAGIKRGTAVDFANRALDCVLSCETRLLIDDIHFLKQRTTSVEISNQFKYISVRYLQLQSCLMR
jgi:AAA domain